MEIHIHSLHDLDEIARKMGYVHRDEMDKLVGARIAALLNAGPHNTIVIPESHELSAVGDLIRSGPPGTFDVQDLANAQAMAERDVAPTPNESPAAVDVQSAAAGNPFAVGEQAAPATRRKTRSDKGTKVAAPAPATLGPNEQGLTGEPNPRVGNTPPPADAAAPQGDAKAWIALLAGEIGTMDLTECLGKAREFIAKHGTAVYDEAFALTDLDKGGVISYSPEQCALLAAALDYLAQRPA